MDNVRREHLVSNICAKYIPGTIDGTRLLFGIPTSYHKMVSNQIYQDWYLSSLQSGLMDEEESVDLAYSRDIWDLEWESILTDLKTDIEKLKIGLFECSFRSNEKRTIKLNLRSAKNKYINLVSRKHSLHENTAEYVAQMIKGFYLSCCEIYLPNENLFIDPEEILHASNLGLTRILDFRQRHILEEPTIRELARNEPWRSIWSLNKNPQELFKRGTTELSMSQHYISIWSSVYDNVNESMDCPADDVLDDDDALDGWFLLQKRKRDKDRNQKQVDAVTGNSKINQADEVYIQTDTPEDAQKIYNMNNPIARSTLRRRTKLIDQKGVVKEAEMPDTKLKLKMAAQQQYIEQVKNKG